ncbi:MAG: Gfo/Idh/MocA family oxidoreductase [Chloroflexi bacterium]|nr:Gfo/Idh/MocA family oxidoreductase [Chloroflexota bacterium]
MSNTKIRVALVGAGGWGAQHARVFSQHPDVELCAVCGRSETRTRARAEAYGLRAYFDVDDMLDEEKPDFVSISLPNQTHFAPTMRVIERGFPLLVEKPLVFDLGEADVLLAAAERRGLFFAINFNHRYAQPVRRAREAIEAGRLGDVVFATWRFGGEGSSTHPHANLIETQCHGFDMLEHLCGPIAALSAEMTDKTGGGFRTLVLSLRFASGAIGSLVGTYDSSYAYRDTHRVEVNGTRGRVLIDDTVKRFEFQAMGNETAEVWQSGYFNDRDREFHRTFDVHLDAMLRAFRAGAAPPIHARAGRRALVLAHAAIESHASGCRVMTE